MKYFRVTITLKMDSKLSLPTLNTSHDEYVASLNGERYFVVLEATDVEEVFNMYPSSALQIGPDMIGQHFTLWGVEEEIREAKIISLIDE